MSLPNSAMKKPANDLTSFDVSKRSPEQIAQLFARWKEQRRRLEHAAEPAPVRTRNLRVMPRPRPSSIKAETPASGRIEHPDARSRPTHYSADFAAVLGAGGDRSAAQQLKNLRLRPARAARTGNTVHSRLGWTLAGAASVIAMTAVAGTVLWPDGSNDSRRLAASTAEPAHVAPVVEPAPDMQPALPLLPAVTRRTVLEPSLQSRLADLARWPSIVETKAPLLPMLKPDSPAIQTASDGIESAELANGMVSALEPVRIAADHPEEFATAAGGGAPDAEDASVPAKAAPRPAAPDDGGRDRPGLSSSSGAFVAGLQGDRSPPDRPSGSTGSNDPGIGGGDGESSGGSGGGGAVSGGGDGPSGSAGGGTGHAGGAADGATGGHSGASGPGSGKSGGGSADSGEAGESGDADRGESGASEGGESGEGESGDGDSEGGDSDGESGESSSRGGLRGAVGGVLGGARDVIGGLGKAAGKAIGGKGKGAGGGKDKGGKGSGGKGNGGGKD